MPRMSESVASLESVPVSTSPTAGLEPEDDGYPTPTSEEQHAVCRKVLRALDASASMRRESFRRPSPRPAGRSQASEEDRPSLPLLDPLLTEKHATFVLSCMYDDLPGHFVSLDASKPWLVYWSVQSLSLLRHPIPPDLCRRSVATIMSCKVRNSGFSGGPDQLSHLAPTFAATHALLILGAYEELIAVRSDIERFLLEMKNPVDGSFRMHEGGEVDMRGTYCALASARLLGFLRTNDRIRDRSAEWIISCQTYEGGFSALPGGEAHGGYTYCAVASLSLLAAAGADAGVGAAGRTWKSQCAVWLALRQMKHEGGFNGRTNKLVDSCYSFWVGAAAEILGVEYNRAMMARYVLNACQAATDGGLRDKPGKSRDLYHTCYALSGLSLSQQVPEQIAETDALHNIRSDLLLRGLPRLAAAAVD